MKLTPALVAPGIALNMTTPMKKLILFRLLAKMLAYLHAADFVLADKATYIN